MGLQMLSRPSKSFLFFTSSGSTEPVKLEVEGQNRLFTQTLIKFSLQILRVSSPS